MWDMEHLPEPNGAFAWVQAAPGPALVCKPLEPYAAHLFTTRRWALGRNGLGSLTSRLDLDGLAGDRRNTAWADVARAFASDLDRLVRLRQVHGAAFVVAREPLSPGPYPEADIVLTDRTDLVLAVQAADCVPILIADRRTGAVAAVHAGWRGLAASAPARAIGALAGELESRPTDLVAAVGPAIGACCYEVGTDVKDRFLGAGFDAEQLGRWFSPTPRTMTRNPPMRDPRSAARQGHWYFDGWAAARDQLEGAGVLRESIHAAELCTASHPAWLCSFRRDGPPAGRLAGAITRRPRP